MRLTTEWNTLFPSFNLAGPIILSNKTICGAISGGNYAQKHRATMMAILQRELHGDINRENLYNMSLTSLLIFRSYYHCTCNLFPNIRLQHIRS